MQGIPTLQTSGAWRTTRPQPDGAASHTTTVEDELESVRSVRDLARWVQRLPPIGEGSALDAMMSNETG
jgi:hypothetical protein